MDRIIEILQNQISVKDIQLMAKDSQIMTKDDQIRAKDSQIMSLITVLENAGVEIPEEIKKPALTLVRE